MEADEKVNRSNWQLPVALACIVLGILVSMQLRARAAASQQPAEPQLQRSMLEMLKAMETERNRLSAELTVVRGQLAELESTAVHRESTVKKIKDQLDQARIQAGLTPLVGPGVVVRLMDSNRQPGPGEDPYYYIIHDVDLQALVNELWAAGAEAVSVNDQRVVARTSIRCVGPTVLVNATRLAAPYVVKAIGPSSDLERALRMAGGFYSSMAPFLANGCQVTISKEPEVRVPAYDGSVIYRYGRPAMEEEQALLID